MPNDKKQFPRGKFSAPPKPAPPSPAPDALPPHSPEAEAAALGCIISVADTFLDSNNAKLGIEQVQAEVDALLSQVKASAFYLLTHRTIFEAMVILRMQNHALNTITLGNYLKAQKTLEGIGGWAFLNSLSGLIPSAFNFPVYLETIREMQHRRWILAKSAELRAYSSAEAVTLEETKTKLAELFDATSKATSTAPMIEFVTPKEAKAFKPDPADFLIGEGLVSRETFNVIGGEPGSGKSRMLTTLAVCGAQGRGLWLGYPVRRKFRTVILQTENTGNRLKEELSAVPEDCSESFRVARAMPHGMAFADPEFRRFLLRLHEKEPFDVLGIDPWNDVVAEEGQSDFAEAFANIRRCFTGRKMPAVVIVAHLRKMRSDASGGRKSGRALLHELSGSLKLGSTARTVFAVQPVTSNMDDDRIVIELAKANDVSPEFFSQYGRRAAYHRRNAIFEPCAEFDWDEWDNPAGNNEERRAITIDMVRECMGKRAGMKASELVRCIAEKFDKGQSTVWRAIREGSGYLSKELNHAAGIVALKKKEAA